MIEWHEKAGEQIQELVQKFGEGVKTVITWNYLAGIGGRRAVSYIPIVGAEYGIIDTNLWQKYQEIWEDNYMNPDIKWDIKMKGKTSRAYQSFIGSKLEDC